MDYGGHWITKTCRLWKHVDWGDGWRVRRCCWSPRSREANYAIEMERFHLLFFPYLPIFFYEYLIKKGKGERGGGLRMRWLDWLSFSAGTKPNNRMAASPPSHGRSPGLDAEEPDCCLCHGTWHLWRQGGGADKCRHLYIYVHVYRHIHIHMSAWERVWIHMYTLTYTYVCMCIHTNVYTYIYTYT